MFKNYYLNYPVHIYVYYNIIIYINVIPTHNNKLFSPYHDCFNLRVIIALFIEYFIFIVLIKLILIKKLIFTVIDIICLVFMYIGY